MHVLPPCQLQVDDLQPLGDRAQVLGLRLGNRFTEQSAHRRLKRL